jgi:hypothetical protein
MEGGDQVFSFGKHQGKTFAWVYENEPGYYDWASGKGGGLKAFSDYGRTRELDAIAPLAGDEEDIDLAASALLRRSGFAKAANEVEKANKKAMKRHREEVADAKFQREVKFRSHGYDSPADFAANEKIHLSTPELKKLDVKKLEDEGIDEEHLQLVSYAKALLEVHRSQDLTERREFPGLMNDSRKLIHNMASSFPDLACRTVDRRDPKDPTKRRRYGKTVGKMIIEKKKAVP